MNVDGASPYKCRRHELERIRQDPPFVWQLVVKGDLSLLQKYARERQKDFCNAADRRGDPYSWIHTSFEGWTLLMKAAEEGHEDVLKYLVSLGADVHACNHKGRSALSFAAAPSHKNGIRRTPSMACVCCLIHAGADVSRVDDHGFSAAQRAEQAGNTEEASLLRLFEKHVGDA